MQWRAATAEDDDRIVEMCLALYAEDPGDVPIDEAQIRRTLEAFRSEPARGRAVVVESEGGIVAGYALLVPFWSNEFGGALCEVDELFIAREHRGRGLGTSIFEAIRDARIGEPGIVGISLVVTDGNDRARRLYERLGFSKKANVMVRVLQKPMPLQA